MKKLYDEIKKFKEMKNNQQKQENFKISEEIWV